MQTVLARRCWALSGVALSDTLEQAPAARPARVRSGARGVPQLASARAVRGLTPTSTPNLHLALPYPGSHRAATSARGGTRRLPGGRQVDLPEDPNLPGAGVAPAKQVFATAAPAAIAAKRSSGDHPSPRTRGLSDGVGRRASASSEAGRAASDHGGEGGADPYPPGGFGFTGCGAVRQRQARTQGSGRRGAGFLCARRRGCQGALEGCTSRGSPAAHAGTHLHRLPAAAHAQAATAHASASWHAGDVAWRVANCAGGCAWLYHARVPSRTALVQCPPALVPRAEAVRASTPMAGCARRASCSPEAVLGFALRVAAAGPAAGAPATPFAAACGADGACSNGGRCGRQGSQTLHPASPPTSPGSLHGRAGGGHPGRRSRHGWHLPAQHDPSFQFSLFLGPELACLRLF
jgi:hypothetical protein